jgi:hypothetical protein
MAWRLFPVREIESPRFLTSMVCERTWNRSELADGQRQDGISTRQPQRMTKYLRRTPAGACLLPRCVACGSAIRCDPSVCSDTRNCSASAHAHSPQSFAVEFVRGTHLMYFASCGRPARPHDCVDPPHRIKRKKNLDGGLQPYYNSTGSAAVLLRRILISCGPFSPLADGPNDRIDPTRRSSSRDRHTDRIPSPITLFIRHSESGI